MIVIDRSTASRSMCQASSIPIVVTVRFLARIFVLHISLVNFENLLQAWVNEQDTMITLCMLHQKHSISEHFEHTLPFLLLKLSFPQQIETASHVCLVDSNQAR